MNKLRLLVVTPFYKPAFVYGGPVRSIPTLCEALTSLGVDVTVYTTNANGETNLDVNPNISYDINNVRVHYFERTGTGNYFFSRQLSNACYNTVSSFDLVYVGSNWAYPFICACRAAKLHNIPYVITPRTSFMRETWNGSKYLKKIVYHRLVERRFLKKASAIHYTTNLEVNESEWLGLDRPLFVVPNPVDIGEFSHLPEFGRFRAAYSIGEQARIVLFLGRIEARKGIDLTLQGFAKIKSVHPESRLVLAGPQEDGYLNIVTEMAKSLDILDQIITPGYLDARQRLEAIVDADVFILTSYSENFGMAVVEAMAGELPVLISDRVGIADDVLFSGAGVVTSLNPEEIGKGLIYLLSSDEHRKEMGCNGRQAAQKYWPQNIAETILAEFESILKNKS